MSDDLPAAETVTSAVHLRPFAEADLPLLYRFATEPAFSLPFEWGGFESPEGFRRQWREDGFLGKGPRLLAVAEADGPAIGWVMWRDPRIFGRTGWCWEIGVILAPEERGRGVGTAAHHLLVRLLLDTTTVHRLCANTEADNTAEQRTLEKCGFRREGVLRKAGYRGGQWRDLIGYALLRDDSPPAG